MNESISWLEIFSLVGSLVSIILAGFAIWLSVKFYEMSSKNTDKLERSSNDISSATDRLETLFEKLYSDTFSMVKDTMNDMRHHVWQSDRLPPSNEARYTQLKEELLGEFEESLSKKVDTEKLDSIRDDLNSLLEKAVSKSRIVSKDITKELVLQTIQDLFSENRPITLKTIAESLHTEVKEIVSEVFSLRTSGEVQWSGEGLSATAPISLLKIPE